MKTEILNGIQYNLQNSFEKIQEFYLKQLIFNFNKDFKLLKKKFRLKFIDQKTYNAERINHKINLSTILKVVNSLHPERKQGNHNVYNYEIPLTEILPEKIPCANFSVLYYNEGSFKIQKVSFITKYGYEYYQQGCDCYTINGTDNISYENVVIKSNNIVVLEQQLERILNEQKEKQEKYVSYEERILTLEKELKLKFDTVVNEFEKEYLLKKEKLIKKFNKENEIAINRVKSNKEALSKEKTYIDREIHSRYRRIFNFR